MREYRYLFVVLVFVLTITSINAEQVLVSQEISTPKQNISKNTDSAPFQDVQNNLKMELAVLEEKVESLSKRIDFLTYPLTIFTVIVVLVTIPSLIFAFRAEQRSSGAHKLAMEGERGTQQRTEEVHKTFLEGSKNTLDLVNATLTLAKEASERSVKFIETKAREDLEKLDRTAKELITRVPPEDDRALVADQKNRRALRSLAQKIASFESRFVLPTELRLTPYCSFIRGMYFHLEEQVEDAFSYWRSVVYDEDTPDALKSLAWYWMGYENNNLGDFAEACLCFQNALGNATGARTYELKRILLESRFFNKLAEEAETLINPFVTLLDEVNEKKEEEFTKVKTRILITAGNIYYERGNELRKNGKNKEAKKMYSEAKNKFEQATHEKWGAFGLAQSLYRLKKVGEAKPYYEQVKQAAILESVNRVEPRTKVLAHSTELICCLVLGEKSAVPHVKGQVITALGVVTEGMTVYSQIQKRNVSKKEFLKDLKELENEFGYRSET